MSWMTGFMKFSVGVAAIVLAVLAYFALVVAGVVPQVAP